MCLSTIYTVSENERNEVMKDVAGIEAEGAGFWASDLFGDRTFIKGRIKSVDFVSGALMVENSDPGG
jgi:predicted RNA-binding protein